MTGDTVSDILCKERTNHVITQTKLLIQPLELSLEQMKTDQKETNDNIKQLTKDFSDVTKKIGEAVINAGNGTITYKFSSRDRAVIIGSAITGITGIVVAIIMVLPQIL